MKRKIKKNIFFLIGLAIITFASSCQANENDLALYGYGYNEEFGTNDSPSAAPHGGIARYINPTTGIDSGTGSIKSPWLTIQYALTHANAGDTIYIRGGVYYQTLTINNATASTKERPIELRSYPGEWAIIDGSKTTGGNIWRVMFESGLVFKNFEMRYSTGPAVSNGLYLEGITDCEFRNLYIHNMHGAGIGSKAMQANKFYNITSKDNYDSSQGGEAADGFSMTSGSNNEFYRCVADHNSDDGYDNWSSSSNRFVDCIAKGNGYGSNGGALSGDGNGFKLGKLVTDAPNAGLAGGNHTLVGCIALDNIRYAFDQNASNVGSKLYNVLAANNGKNFDLGNGKHTIANAISYGSKNSDNVSANIQKTCLGGGFGGSANAAMFESVLWENLNNKTVGSRFFRPNATLTTLIDKGTNVGEYYAGTLPDIGAREYVTEIESTSPSVPEPSTTNPGSFEFSTSSYSIGESAGKVDVTIRRTGGSDGIVSVQWRTLVNTATFDADYASFSWLTLNFANGETSKTLPINIAQDTLSEGNEVFSVLLQSPTNGATLGTLINVPVTIVDDDATPPTVEINYGLADFSRLALSWLKSGVSLEGDINKDGKVNSKDLGIMMSNWE